MADKITDEFLPLTYGYSRGWKISGVTVSVSLALFFSGFSMILLLTGSSRGMAEVIFLPMIGICGSLFFFYAAAAIFKFRIEICADRLIARGVFRDRELLFSHVEGFRIKKNSYTRVIEFVPVAASGRKKIKGELLFEHSDRFIAWAGSMFTNLDAKEYGDELQQVMHNTGAGITGEQRLAGLKRYRRIAWLLNILSVALFLWAVLRPVPYALLTWILMLLPPAVIALIFFSNGLLMLDKKRGSAYPSAAGSFIIPSMCLALRAFLDWNILSYKAFWLPFAVVTVLVYLLLVVSAADLKKLSATAIITVLFCAVYSYGTVITFNGIRDRSEPLVFRPVVTGKHISSGKYRFCYLDLEKWGPYNSGVEVMVTRPVFDRYNAGDTAKVYVRSGALGMEWFFIE